MPVRSVPCDLRLIMASCAQGSSASDVNARRSGNNELNVLSVDDVVEQLTQAQCMSADDTKRMLRDITLRLSRAHSSITQSALCLLEIHPHVTIPYIADLISDGHEDTTLLLQVYSSLLQTDRTLLVPIIGSLSDINLSSIHMMHMRNTLSFALSIVEQDDLPTIIRALLRCTQNNTASAPSSSVSNTLRWTCEQIRHNLTDVKPNVLIVISLVLQEYLHCAHDKIGYFFRSVLPAQSSLLHWFDLCIWTLSLSPRTVSTVPQHETKTALHRAIGKGTLFSCLQLWKLKQHMYVLGDLMKKSEHHHAIQKLIIFMTVSCPLRLGCVVGCIQLVSLILTHSSLACSTTFLTELDSQLSSAFDNKHNVVIPLVRHVLTRSSVQSLLSPPSPSTPRSKWANELIKIRKTLIFGHDNSTISKQQDHNQRDIILKIINLIDCAPGSIILDIVNLLNDHVPVSLSERLAVDTLFLANEITIMIKSRDRGTMGDESEGDFDKVEDILSKMYTERVEKQCVKGWITQCEDVEVKSIGIHEAKTIKIDIGLIWNQPLLSVTHLACFAVQHLAGGIHFNLLNVSVLVPVVCVALYEAVDHQKSVKSSREEDGDDGGGYEHELSKQVLQMNMNELLKGLCSFSVGISIIISVLNFSARQSLSRWKRILERRASTTIHENSDEDCNESTDHRVTWVLLERLTELHRMLNTLTLTYNVIMHKSGRGGGRGRGRSSHPGRSDMQANILQQQQDFIWLNNKAKGSKKKTADNCSNQAVLNRSIAIMANVSNALFSTTGFKPPNFAFDSDETKSKCLNLDDDDYMMRYCFPEIRLETLVAGLAAVPDDSETLEEGKTTNTNVEDEHERDSELIEMDKFLLRLLLRTMRENNNTRGPVVRMNAIVGNDEDKYPLTNSSQERADGTSNKNSTSHADQSENDLEFGLNKRLRLDEISQDDAKSILKDLNKKMKEENINIFLDESLSKKRVTRRSGDDSNRDDDDDDDDNDDDGLLDENEKNISSRQWAIGTKLDDRLKNFKVEYIKDCVDSIYRSPHSGKSTIHVSEILYSPTFAALLLDRAATCVGLSRHLRGRQRHQQGGREGGRGRRKLKTSAEMNDLLCVSGMALSCLMMIIREVVSFYKEAESENDDIWNWIRMFVENTNTHILTRVHEGVDQSLINLDDAEDERRYGHMFKALQWIIHTSPDSMISNMACEIVMTLAELDVLPSRACRQCVFTSLVTVYELDSAINEAYDLQLMMCDGFNSWVCRHRGIATTMMPNVNGGFNRKRGNLSNMSNLSVCMSMSMKHGEMAEFTGDLPPWIVFHDAENIKSHEYHRLMCYFNGMHVTNALVEGLGWVFELTCMKHIKQCDILIDMLGFQPIVTMILDIVKQSLMACAIDTMLPVQQLSEDVLHPLFLSVYLFNETQRMYNDNQQRLMKDGTTVNSNKDETFHYDLTNKYISLVQLSHRRVGELNQWHSNEMIDMSQMDQSTLDTIHQLVGLCAKSLMYCYQFTQSLEALASAKTGNKQRRKKPAYIQGRQHDDDISAPESRACKLIPRLSHVCEQLDKSLNRLSENLGIKPSVKLTSFAPTSISAWLPQKRLVFGVGLDYTGNTDEGEIDNQGEEEEEEEIVVKDLGFHTRRPGQDTLSKDVHESGEIDTPTISVRFRR